MFSVPSRQPSNRRRARHRPRARRSACHHRHRPARRSCCPCSRPRRRSGAGALPTVGARPSSCHRFAGHRQARRYRGRSGALRNPCARHARCRGPERSRSLRAARLVVLEGGIQGATPAFRGHRKGCTQDYGKEAYSLGSTLGGACCGSISSSADELEFHSLRRHRAPRVVAPRRVCVNTQILSAAPQ